MFKVSSVALACLFGSGSESTTLASNSAAGARSTISCTKNGARTMATASASAINIGMQACMQSGAVHAAAYSLTSIVGCCTTSGGSLSSGSCQCRAVDAANEKKSCTVDTGTWTTNGSPRQASRILNRRNNASHSFGRSRSTAPARTCARVEAPER